jgi:hypothetical protein
LSHADNRDLQTFMDALDTFEGVYRFIPFNFTFSNGSVTGTFQALFVRLSTGWQGTPT